MAQHKQRTQECGPKEIYEAMAAKLLKDNPEWWSKKNRCYTSIKHFYVYRYEVMAGGRMKPVEVISYTRFKAIMDTFFRRAQHRITHGEKLALGHRLGYIAPRRVERNHSKKSVNWKLTMQQPRNPVTGRRPAVFWTDDYYVRIGWERTKKQRRKMKQYQFDPTKGTTASPGFQEAFSQANMANKLLAMQYKYYPFIDND